MDTPSVQRWHRPRRHPPRIVRQTIQGLGRADFFRAPGHEAVLVILEGIGKLLTEGGTYRFAAPCTLLLGSLTRCSIVNQGAGVMHVIMASAPRAPSGAWR